MGVYAEYNKCINKKESCIHHVKKLFICTEVKDVLYSDRRLTSKMSEHVVKIFVT